MYDRFGSYNPLNEFVTNYKHKNVIDMYKKISVKRLTKNNTLLQLYEIVQIIELHIEQLKSKHKTHPNHTKQTK